MRFRCAVEMATMQIHADDECKYIHLGKLLVMPVIAR
jgi:hypothetical protein